MRRALPRAILAVGLLALLTCASAYALKIVVDKMVVSATVDSEPRALPAARAAPISLTITTRVKTTDGSPPPSLREIIFMFDKNATIDTEGLAVCTAAKLAETTPAVARKRCPGAIVGEGVGKAEVNLPGSSPIQISSPLTFFNAPPVGGRPSLIAHAYETVPEPKTLLVPLSIERISHGRYGYRVKVQMPEIAGGFGAATLAEATIDKTWKRGGKTVGYTNARCSGGRLQVHGSTIFADGSFFPGTLTSPCHVSG